MRDYTFALHVRVWLSGATLSFSKQVNPLPTWVPSPRCCGLCLDVHWALSESPRRPKRHVWVAGLLQLQALNQVGAAFGEMSYCFMRLKSLGEQKGDISGNILHKHQCMAMRNLYNNWIRVLDDKLDCL